MKPYTLNWLDDCGDATSRYRMTFSKEITLREFIESMPADPREWGTIYVDGKEIIEYKQGCVVVLDPIEYFMNCHRIIDAGRAHGGWSLMDYRLDLRPDPKVVETINVDLHAHTNFEF